MKSRMLLFASLFLILISQAAFAKSYSYDYVKTNLYFDSSGTVIVSQERDYDFSGSFSYAYLDILKKGATNVEFLGITDLDTNQSLTYDLQDTSNDVKATWYYTANNQVKRFLIVYRIDGAIKRYQDVAEFYWKVIEDSHESIAKLDTYVNLPVSSPNLFKIFVHSSSSPGQMDFSKDFRSANVTMQDIPSNTFVEFRILTDTSVFSGVKQIGSNDYENILNQERSIFNSPSVSFIENLWLLIVLTALPIILFVYFYIMYGRDPKVDYELKYEQEPPGKIPPMALSNLLEGEEVKTGIKREAMGLIATFFDLARRGYLEISEEKKKGFLGLNEKTEQVFTLTQKGKNKKNLEGFEKDILTFLFSCGSDKKRVTSSEITNYCRWNGYLVQDKIEKIDDKARKWFEKEYFPITEKISSDAKKIFSFILIAYIIGLFIYIGITGNVLLLIPVFVAVFMTFLSNVISKRTHPSTLEMRKWKAFKNYIKDFSDMKNAPVTLLKIWDEYLVYAIALGVATELLENLKDMSISTGKPMAAVAWYHGIYPISGNVISPQVIESFVGSMSHTVGALSSSTSVGGGFSSGGGGGGGGGGSGAG